MGENLFLFAVVLLPLLAGAALRVLYKRVRAGAIHATRSQVVLGNGLIMLGLLSLVLLVGELYFRFVYDTTDSLMYTKASQRWVARYYILNTAGVRDNVEYHFFVEAGKRRISFLGDSFTAGHGIKSVEDRFANIIRASHPEWEVHTIARRGFETKEEIEFLNLWVTNRYQLETLVLVYCLNDNSDLIPERRAAIDRIHAKVKNSNWFIKNSYFLNILGHRWQAMRDPFVRGYFDMVQDAYKGPLWDIQKQRLEFLKSYVEANGGRFAVVTFPFLHSLGESYPYVEVHAQLDDFWRERGVPHLDLLPLFKGMRPEELTVNRFDAHPNERASAMAAQEIGRFLEGLLKAPNSGDATIQTNSP